MTKTYMSNSGIYRLVVQENTLSVYSNKTNELCGSLDTDANYFTYLFFTKDDKEYFIHSSQIGTNIINCETGHTYDLGNKYCWNKIWQVDSKTICIIENKSQSQYRFYDVSNIFYEIKELNVVVSDSIQFQDKIDYFLICNDKDEITISSNKIKLSKTQQRVRWLGKRKIDHLVDEIDMCIMEYEKQLENLNGFEIYDYQKKIYNKEMVRMIFERKDNHMVLIDIWKSDQ